MGRVNTIAALPESIRLELERQSRNNVAPKDLMVWLEGEGYSVGYQPINRFVRKIKNKVEQAQAQAEYAVAIDRAADLTGVDLKESLLDLAKIKLLEGLNGLNGSFWVDMKPSELFAAIARITTVDIQSQKWQADLKDRMTAEMKFLEGDPDISLDTLKKVRETIYGIFDNASN